DATPGAGRRLHSRVLGRAARRGAGGVSAGIPGRPAVLTHVPEAPAGSRGTMVADPARPRLWSALSPRLPVAENCRDAARLSIALAARLMLSAASPHDVATRGSLANRPLRLHEG